MNLSKKTKVTLSIGMGLLLIGGFLAYWLIPKPPETRFMERWQINVEDTLKADPAFAALDNRAQNALMTTSKEFLESTRYEFTSDGLVLFGRNGRLLPIARYTVEDVQDTGVSLNLEYLGLREGVSEMAQLQYSSLRGLTLVRGSHVTVLARD